MRMSFKTGWLVCIFIMVCAASAQAGIYGNWLTEDAKSVIKISKCGNAICGKILTGVPKGAKDVKNKNPKLRDRSLKGMQFFKLLNTKVSNKWSGELYNARDGKTYKGNITLIDAKKLELEGCVFVFCKTAKWTKK